MSRGKRLRGGTESWRSPEHMKEVVVKVVADHPEGFRVQTRGPRESEVCVILRYSEKHCDPLVYPFSSFPSLEHIFLCWRLIYNSGQPPSEGAGVALG